VYKVVRCIVQYGVSCRAVDRTTIHYLYITVTLHFNRDTLFLACLVGPPVWFKVQFAVT